jgi:hypothetical protein
MPWTLAPVPLVLVLKGFGLNCLGMEAHEDINLLLARVLPIT